METHVDARVTFDEVLELLDDRVERHVDAREMFNVRYHLIQPLFQDILVVG
jgi:hypothetical protein